MTETFSVALFFPDGSYIYEAKELGAESAVNLAKQCTDRSAARAGFVTRIIITDSFDCTCFEWKFGEGVTFPRYDPEKGAFVE